MPFDPSSATLENSFDPTTAELDTEGPKKRAKEAGVIETAKQTGLGLGGKFGEGSGNTVGGLGRFIQAPAASALELLTGLGAAISDEDYKPGRQELARDVSEFARQSRQENIDNGNAFSVLGKGMENVGDETRGYWQKETAKASPIMVEQSKNIQDATGFTGKVGAMASNPIGTLGSVAQSLPDMAFGAGVGSAASKIAARAIEKEAVAAAEAAGHQALLDAAKSPITAARASEAASVARQEAYIATKQNAMERAAASAGASSEAAQSGMSSQVQMLDMVKQMPSEKLYANNDYYRQMIDSGVPEGEAKARLGESLAAETGGLSALFTRLGTAVTGGAEATAKTLVGGKMSKADFVRRTGQDTGEEALQGVGEGYAQHRAEAQVDPNAKFDFGGTLAENAVAGLVMGAGGHGAGYVSSQRTPLMIAGISADRIPDAKLEAFAARMEKVGDPKAEEIRAEIDRRKQQAAPINQEDLLQRLGDNDATPLAAESDQGSSDNGVGGTGNPSDQPGVEGGAGITAGSPMVGSGTNQPVGGAGQNNGAVGGLNLDQNTNTVAEQGVSSEKIQAKAASVQDAGRNSPGSNPASGLVSERGVESLPARDDHAAGIIGQDTFRAAEAVANAFGNKLAIINTPGVDASHNAGTLSISPRLGMGRGSIAVLQTVGHEVKHSIERYSPEVARHLESVILSEAPEINTDAGLLKYASEYAPGVFTPQAIQQRRSSGMSDLEIVNDLAKNLGGNYNAEAIRREFTNDVAGNRFAEPGFRKKLWAEIARKDATALGKIKNILDAAIKSLQSKQNKNGFSADKYIRDLEKVRNEVAKAYAEHIVRIDRVKTKTDAELSLMLRGQTDSGVINYIKDEQAMRSAGEQMSPRRAQEAENREGVIVGARPGEFDWTFDSDKTVPPIQAPAQIGPRVERIGPRMQKILSSKGVKQLIEDTFGVTNLKVYPTLGQYKGKPEPSFALYGDGMTFEAADGISRMLGFSFAQESTIVTQPVYAGDEDTWPAFYVSNGKKLTAKEVDAVRQEAQNIGMDYSTSIDGTAFKFFFDGSDISEFAQKIEDLARVAGLKNVDRVATRSTFNEAADYLRSSTEGTGRQAWVSEGGAGSSSLFGRTVDHLVVPYAKAVGAEGYRFSPSLFADRFGLSSQQLEYLRAALRPKNGALLSTADIVSGREVLETTKSDNRAKTPRANNTDVMFALQNRAAAIGQIEPGDYSDEAKKAISQAMADEVVEHLSRPGGKSAIGWYDAALKRAKSIYHQIFPELETNKDREMLFDALLGIASQGNDVHSNSVFAGRMYQLIARQGNTISQAVEKLYGTFGGETRAIENNFLKFEELIDRNGYDKMRKLFNQKKSVGEWNAILRRDESLYYNGSPLSVEGTTRQMVNGWMVFGPKIGSFINNLHGDYSTLTADLWFSRTWNRILGFSFLHTPLQEASKYQSFKDALIAEFNKTTEPRSVAANGNIKHWEHGKDLDGATKEDLDALLADPEAMLAKANELYKYFKDGYTFSHKKEDTGNGFSTKSDLRRAAKNWIEFREGSVAAPRNDSERTFQQETAEEAQKIIKRKTGEKITIADIQAALWYHEKELFKLLGVSDKKRAPADYADAAEGFMERYNGGDLFHVEKPSPKYILGKKGDYLESTKLSPSRLSQTWNQLASQDNAFQFPKSEKIDLEGVMADIDPGYSVKKLKSVYPGAESRKVEAQYRIMTPDGKHEAMVFVTPEKLWIDASKLKSGMSGGSKIYAALLNYAHNAGLKFVGDYAGVSPIATFRRTENMMSAALKFGGKTGFMAPSATQMNPQSFDKTQLGHESGVTEKLYPVGWVDGDDKHNLESLMKASYENVAMFVPEIQNVIYDASIKDFKWATTDRVVSAAEWSVLSKQLRQGLVGIHQPGDMAGEVLGIKSGEAERSTTLKRAAFTNTVLQVESGFEGGELLDGLGRELQRGVPNQLDGALYSPERFNEISDDFKKRVDAALNKERNTEQVVVNESAPASVLVFGFPQTRLVIDPSDLNKIANKKGFETNQSIGNLVHDIGRPAAIFWNEKNGSLNMLRQKPMFGMPGIIAIRPDVASKTTGRVHLLVSAHSIDGGAESIIRKINSGELKSLYVDKDADILPGLKKAILQKKYRANITESLTPGQHGARSNVQLGTASRLLGPEDLVNLEAKFSPVRGATAMPEETKTQFAQRRVQDKFNRFEVANQWAKDNGVQLSEQANVYRAEERYHGRVATRLEDFREKTVKPLVEETQKAGFTMQDVSDFLEAQHTPEANAQARKIQNDPAATAAGLSDQDAQTYLASASPELKRLANKFRDITEQSKSLLLQSGIIGQDTANAWSSAYKHYVPLKGGEDSQAQRTGTGKGMSVNGKQKRRLGHGKRDEHIVENIIRDYESSVIASEKNLVGQHLLEMSLQVGAIDPDLITVGKPEKRKVLMPGKSSYAVTYHGSVVASFQNRNDAATFIKTMGKQGMQVVEDKGDPYIQMMAVPTMQENEAVVYVGGKAIRIQINDEILATAYKNLGTEHLNWLLSVGRGINNWLSKAYTGYNPEFVFVNLFRDFTGGTINLMGNYGSKVVARTMKAYPKAFADMFMYSLRGRATQDIQQYRDNGGSTGAAYLSDIERIGKDITDAYNEYVGPLENLKKGQYKAAASAAGRKVVGRVLGWIEHLNAASENAMRLAAFVAVRDSTGSVAEASSAAKNATVNFNRKGEIGSSLGAVYLFANPNIQGSAALYKALFQSQHKAEAWALVAGMVALAMLAAAQFDDDEWKEIPDSEKDRNLLIRAGDKRIKIPVPYGYGFFFGLGNIYRNIQAGESVLKQGTHLASSFFEHFSPMGNPVSPTTEGSFMNVMPTAIQMAGRPAMNVNGFGGKIVPTFGNNDEGRPDFLKMNRSTKGSGYDATARWFSSMSGGTKGTAGALDMSPETLKYWTKATTGGTGAFYADSYNAIKLAVEGASPELNEMPIARKFAGEHRINDTRQNYYEKVKDAEAALAAFNAAKKERDQEGVQKIMSESKDLIALAKAADGSKKAFKAIRDREVELLNDESKTLAYRREAVKVLEKREEDLYRRILNSVKR